MGDGSLIRQSRPTNLLQFLKSSSQLKKWDDSIFQDQTDESLYELQLMDSHGRFSSVACNTEKEMNN